ncbi:MAG TPA: acetyltransferase [Thermoanaerobaculia bacterium]|nr:acetyltransferase [Thermoanaerobaculia bacterium]
MTRSEIAESVRRALVERALRAYEDAGVLGLCEEGRWEAAVDAMKSLDLDSIPEPADPPER